VGGTGSGSCPIVAAEPIARPWARLISEVPFEKNTCKAFWVISTVIILTV
jgi:hypothetical protein